MIFHISSSYSVVSFVLYAHKINFISDAISLSVSAGNINGSRVYCEKSNKKKIRGKEKVVEEASR